MAHHTGSGSYLVTFVINQSKTDIQVSRNKNFGFGYSPVWSKPAPPPPSPIPSSSDDREGGLVLIRLGIAKRGRPIQREWIRYIFVEMSLIQVKFNEQDFQSLMEFISTLERHATRLNFLVFWTQYMNGCQGISWDFHTKHYISIHVIEHVPWF